MKAGAPKHYFISLRPETKEGESYLLQLVSINGTQITQSLYQPNEAHQSIKKCLSFIKNVLHLEANMAKFESTSSSYRLLLDIGQSKKFIEFQGKIFIPARNQQDEIWGFVQIKALNKKEISSVKLKKAINAVESIISPNLNSNNATNKNHFSTLLTNIPAKASYSYALSQYHKSSYSSFVNLNEWISDHQPLSLKDLREFKNSLFYVPEVTKLTTTQRSTLALFSMLPIGLRKSSLILSTELSAESLKNKLQLESGFLGTFSKEKFNHIDSVTGLSSH